MIRVSVTGRQASRIRASTKKASLIGAGSVSAWLRDRALKNLLKKPKPDSVAPTYDALRLRVCVTGGERDQIFAAAKRAGLTVSTWLREIGLSARG